MITILDRQLEHESRYTVSFFFLVKAADISTINNQAGYEIDTGSERLPIRCRIF